MGAFIPDVGVNVCFQCLIILQYRSSIMRRRHSGEYLWAFPEGSMYTVMLLILRVLHLSRLCTKNQFLFVHRKKL